MFSERDKHTFSCLYLSLLTVISSWHASGHCSLYSMGVQSRGICQEHCRRRVGATPLLGETKGSVRWQQQENGLWGSVRVWRGRGRQW